jgi:hypothetical protein
MKKWAKKEGSCFFSKKDPNRPVKESAFISITFFRLSNVVKRNYVLCGLFFII